MTYYDLEIVLSMNQADLNIFKRASAILIRSGMDRYQAYDVLIKAFVQRRQDRERVQQNRRAS